MDVDPGKPLAAITQFSADTKAKRWQHLGKCSSPLAKHCPETGDNYSGAFLRRNLRLLLPAAGNLSQKTAPRR